MAQRFIHIVYGTIESKPGWTNWGLKGVKAE